MERSSKRREKPPKKVKVNGDPHRRLHLDKKATALAEVSNEKDADDLLTTEQVAQWLGTSTQFVEIARIKDYGPKFTRLSARCIRYKRSDVAAWLRSRVHSSTKEYA